MTGEFAFQPERAARPWTQRIAFACALVVALLLIFAVERDAGLTMRVGVFFAGCCGLVFLATKRPWFSLAAMTLCFIGLFVTSNFKFSVAAMNLHVYDLVFYLSNLAQFSFFGETYAQIALAASVGAGLAVAALAGLWFLERRIAVTRRAALAAALLSLMAAGGATALTIRTGASFFNERENVFSAFIASLGDVPALMRTRGFLQMSAQASPEGGIVEPIVCQPRETPPDIVLFLNESAMPPGVYPQLAYPDEARGLFESFDGKIHKLRVETFGGGTWLSDFSALTGLSTNMFGSMRNFATQISAGRLRHTLPQYLKACGYDTTLIYPSLAEFAGSARFYRAIGIDRVIDRKIHKAPNERQRDTFYLDQARAVFDRARAQENARPQFVVVSNMSTHSPWDFRFAPEALKPGEPTRWTGDQQFDEYLWRLVLAKRDRDAFRAKLAQDFPGKPFLFVSYGDHQPALARLPLENALEIADAGSAWQLDSQSRAFETYFAIDGLGFTPRVALPDREITEIPHLPTLTLMAAGLPLDAVYTRRRSLMEACRGLYSSCADKGAVLGYQAWLKSGAKQP